jgi:hypothetical protein
MCEVIILDLFPHAQHSEYQRLAKSAANNVSHTTHLQQTRYKDSIIAFDEETRGNSLVSSPNKTDYTPFLSYRFGGY